MRIGVHNLHDKAGRPSPFADIVFFTEVAGPASRFSRLQGYDTLTCKRQPSLAIAFKRRLFDPVDGIYRLAHDGLEGVTPNRGTYVVLGDLHVDGEHLPTALLVEHRINAAFPPYVRGEESFRRHCWETHTALTLNWICELDKRGYLVIAGGDLNTPGPDVYGYRGALHEQGRGYDRLASTKRVTRLIDPEYLSRAGSDHPRLRATLEVRKSH